MKYNKDKISVITICFNSAKTIRQTIESVLNQTYSNIEYIIVDGMSSDNTLEIIKEYEQLFNDKEISYRYISEPDNGIYDAMNKGIRMATGEWIGIINSDDWYQSDSISNVAKYYIDNPSDIIYGITQTYENEVFRQAIQNSHLLWHKLRFGIYHPSVFISKAAYIKYGNYNLSYSVCADIDLMLKMRDSRAAINFIPFVLANFRFGSGAGSKHFRKGKLEHLEILYKYGYLSYFKLNLLKIITFFYSFIRK